MQRKVLGKSLTLVVGTTVIIGIVEALTPTNAPSAPTLQVPVLAECPHRYDSLALPHNLGIHPGGDLALVGRKTNVPEFHDCQKFVVDSSGVLVFGQLVAIFASFRLDVLIDSLCTLYTPRSGARRAGRMPRACVRPGASVPASSGGPSDSSKAGGPAIAAAVVLNLGQQPYGYLGIEPAFNCLFLYFDGTGRLRAKMVPVGRKEQDCIKTINPDSASGKMLKLVQTYWSPHDVDYPAVARWDWHHDRKKQSIGIKCGASWCEIGDSDFTPGPAYSDASAPPGWEKIFRIKGWYDEQFLAEASGDSPDAPLKPSSIRAAIFPHPSLETHDDISDFHNRWVQTAVVFLSSDHEEYSSKLNLIGTPQGANLNRLYLCHGKRSDCLAGDYWKFWLRPTCSTYPVDTKTEDKDMWWGMVRNGNGTARYYCIHRRGHEDKNIHVVGTARWRWVVTDDTGWERCLEGCCEVQRKK